MAGVKEVRLYRPGDEIGITKLFREVFGREMSLREWQWKYRDSYPSKVYSSVAVDYRGDIVGHYGGVCLPLIHSGKPARGLAICDVMVHPKYRGIKTLKELSFLVPHEAVADGIIMGYGFPNEMTLLKPALSLGIYEKVEDVLEGNKKAVFRGGISHYMVKLFPLDHADGKIDDLWDAHKSKVALAVVRDRRYFAWRYQNHPLYQYELWGLKRRMGGNLLGLAVLKRENQRVLIMDFLTGQGFLGVLMMKIENYVSITGGNRISLWFPPSWAKTFEDQGFSISPAGTSVPRTTHERTLGKKDMHGKFFYTMGDTDFL